MGVRGITPWMVRAENFYRVDTAIVVPAIEPTDWELRIHGMVDRELTLTYQDLISARGHAGLGDARTASPTRSAAT